MSTIQALDFCQGTPVYPGIRRRTLVASVSSIAGWPTLPLDELGRPKGAKYEDAFVMAEGQYFLPLDHTAAKAEFKSESQGEYQSKTFKVTLALTYPGVDQKAADAATAYNLTRCVALVEDMDGRWRVVGCERYDGAEVTVSRDQGQGATGSAATVITFTADDIADAPFYDGPIETPDGTINPTAPEGD